MKSSAVLVFALLTGFCLSCLPKISFGQSENKPKKIEVVGTAEMEITPDEIFLNIALREYLKDGKNRVTIAQLEKELYDVVMKAGISKDDFTIENVYGYNYEWRKKKNEEFFARKMYRIKLNDLDKVNNILSSIEQKGIESVNIGEVSHSNIEELKMELKAKALLAAKEKANYLAKSIGEETGSVLEIQEIHDGYAQPFPEMRTMDLKSDAMDEADPRIDFKKIKLKYEMKAVFEIK